MKGLFLAAFSLVSLSIFAQDAGDNLAFALLYPAENEGVLVIREGRSLRLADASLPTVLVPGDQITTDGSTTAEIITYPSRSRLVLGENSSVLIDRLDQTFSELTIQYGRLRGDVRQTDAASLRVNGIASTAVSQEGSFGVDQLVDTESGDIVARVYALEGKVSVYAEQSAGEGLSSDEAVELSAGQVVTQRGTDSIAQPGSSPAGISAYWTSRTPVAPIVDPVDLLDAYEPLEAEVESVLGTLPSYLFPPEPVAVAAPESAPDPAPEPEPAAEEPAPSQPLPERAPNALEDDQTQAPIELTNEDVLRRRQSSVLRTTGAIVAAGGVLADISAIALNRYGAEVMNNWEQIETQTLNTLSYTGGGLIASGLLLLSLSVIIGN